MNGIGWAVKEMRNGARVRRAGWNGKGMWVGYVPDWSGAAGALVGIDYHWKPFIVMFTADKGLVPWLCSQTDLLAMDWEVAT